MKFKALIELMANVMAKWQASFLERLERALFEVQRRKDQRKLAGPPRSAVQQYAR